MIYTQPLSCSEIKLLGNNWQATFKAEGPCEPLATEQTSKGLQYTQALFSG